MESHEFEKNKRDAGEKQSGRLTLRMTAQRNRVEHEDEKKQHIHRPGVHVVSLSCDFQAEQRL